MGGNGGDAASFGAVINIPFSWEHKPGVSKVAAAYGAQISGSRRRHHHHHHHKLPSKYAPLLPPPPPLKRTINSYQQESEAELGSKLLPVDDPFLVAYWKCTDQEASTCSRMMSRSRRRCSSKRATAAALLCPTSGALSCKYSCGVRSDNLGSLHSSSIHQRQNAILPAASPPTKLYKG